MLALGKLMKVNDRPLLGVKRGFLGLQFGDYPSKPVDISLYTLAALGIAVVAFRDVL